jgi:hypothetical protein
MVLFSVLFPYFFRTRRSLNVEDQPFSLATMEDEMANKIDTVTARNKLSIRREAYYQRISKGFYIGFRKMSETSSGTWVVRRVDEYGQKVERSLGAFDDYPQYERFDRAMEAAREWMSQVAMGGARGCRPCTDGDGCLRCLRGPDPGAQGQQTRR